MNRFAAIPIRRQLPAHHIGVAISMQPQEQSRFWPHQTPDYSASRDPWNRQNNLKVSNINLPTLGARGFGSGRMGGMFSSNPDWDVQADPEWEPVPDPTQWYDEETYFPSANAVIPKPSYYPRDWFRAMQAGARWVHLNNLAFSNLDLRDWLTSHRDDLTEYVYENITPALKAWVEASRSKPNSQYNLVHNPETHQIDLVTWMYEDEPASGGGTGSLIKAGMGGVAAVALLGTAGVLGWLWLKKKK